MVCGTSKRYSPWFMKEYNMTMVSSLSHGRTTLLNYLVAYPFASISIYPIIWSPYKIVGYTQLSPLDNNPFWIVIFYSGVCWYLIDDAYVQLRHDEFGRFAEVTFFHVSTFCLIVSAQHHHSIYFIWMLRYNIWIQIIECSHKKNIRWL